MIVPLSDIEVRGKPRSSWTKHEIVTLARLHGANDQAITILKKMPARDVLKITLVPVGYCICGSMNDYDKRSKTMYYEPDYEFIKSLGGSCHD